MKPWIVAASHSLRGLFAVLVTGLALGSSPAALAHDPGLSIANAGLDEGRLRLHLTMARSDMERLVTLDADRNGKISDPEFEAALPQLRRQAERAFEINRDGGQLSLTEATVQRDQNDGIHFELTFANVTSGLVTIRSTLLGELPRGHRQYLTFGDGKQRLAEQMLDSAHDSLAVRLATIEKAATPTHSFRQFLGLGIEHILTGYDHLLFLLGLLVVGGSLRSALQIITSFTIAHSITLALATLNVIRLPASLIEPLIAASIVYVGFENIVRPGNKNRWRLTFAFGLIHGCGFASALRDLGIGAHGTSVVVPLLSFNLGVEAGQLGVAALALPLIWKCRANPIFVRRWVPAGSALIVLAGGYWLVQRTLF